MNSELSREKKGNEELKVSEVNIYEKDCGEVMLHCVTDCIIIGTSWINPDR